MDSGENGWQIGAQNGMVPHLLVLSATPISRSLALTLCEIPEALDRLRVVASTQDGFRIAEEDLRQRGAGDLQGTRQSGTPELRFADLGTYVGLVERARKDAEAVLAEDPDLAQPEHAALRRAVKDRFEEARPVAEEAG